MLFDGVDIAQAAPHDVRSHIAFVAQDPAIFSGTIAENIRYGRPPMLPTRKWKQAAVAAAADEFIRVLPQGYVKRPNSASAA